MPPIELPIRQARCLMPRPMTNACAALAPSSIDSSGKARRYLSPLSGLLDAGPVEPLQLPSALAQITNQRLVSIGLSGPSMASHQPSLGSSARSEEHTSELQSLM